MAGFLFQWREAIQTAHELTASDRHVAHVIGFRMDSAGNGAYPSLARIVEATALSKSTVLDSIGWLDASGWLRSVSRGRRETKRYLPAIPAERKTRADRTHWVVERKEQLASRRASRSESQPTQSVGIVTHSTPSPSRSESLLRVGRNGDAESVGIVAHEYSTNSPKNSPNASTNGSLDVGQWIEGQDEDPWGLR